MSVILERPWKQSNNIATLQNILGTFALVLPSEAKYKLLKELSPISSETNIYLLIWNYFVFRLASTRSYTYHQGIFAMNEIYCKE